MTANRPTADVPEHPFRWVMVVGLLLYIRLTLKQRPYRRSHLALRSFVALPLAVAAVSGAVTLLAVGIRR